MLSHPIDHLRGQLPEAQTHQVPKVAEDPGADLTQQVEVHAAQVVNLESVNALLLVLVVQFLPNTC